MKEVKIDAKIILIKLFKNKSVGIAQELGSWTYNITT